MSHHVDFDAMHEKLILLQHFSFGSEQYCRERLIGSEQDIGNGSFDEYWGWVKGIVSSYTLECSIRLRVLLDTISNSPKADQIVILDSISRSDLVIGQVIKGDFDLTLRESCNKIIHARKVVPIWSTGSNGNTEFNYWSGNYELSGTKGNKNWCLLLHISPWTRCVERFLKEAERAELTLYMGQDWY